MRKGFTLVELSIVLVILGLLVGGVLAGQNLIRAAELRSVLTEYSQWQTAVTTFQEKFFAIPGDMNNATAFWGAADGGDGTGDDCALVESTDETTCDGDGDGQLEDMNITIWMQNENFRFWQHLANAGLIEGTYTGRGDATHATTPRFDANINLNVPGGKLGDSHWAVEAPCSGSGGACDGTGYNYGNQFIFGKTHVNYYANATGIMKAEEAWGIDKKADDGQPRSGKVFGIGGSNCSDASSITDTTAEYNLDSTDTLACSFMFMRSF